MASSRKQGWLVPALVVLIAGTVVADMARRAFNGRARPAPTAVRPTTTAPGRRSAPRPDRALTSTAQSGRTEPAGEAETARRQRIRQRIRDQSARTYLPETLSQTDSMLRRWPDDRIGRHPAVAVFVPPLQRPERFLAAGGVPDPPVGVIDLLQAPSARRVVFRRRDLQLDRKSVV